MTQLPGAVQESSEFVDKMGELRDAYIWEQDKLHLIERHRKLTQYLKELIAKGNKILEMLPTVS